VLVRALTQFFCSFSGWVLQAENIRFADSIFFSLEKQAERRATPWRMLEHPWMVEMKGKRVNMVQFLKTVWDWQD